MAHILLTSAGRRVELVRQFRRAFDRSDATGKIIATDVDWLAPALQEVDRPYLVPPVDAPSYIPKLVDICLRERIDLVLPLIDPDIPRLAQHRREIEQTGARVCVLDPPGAVVSGDKWQAVTFFRSLGLATPASWLPHEVDAEQLRYPLFLKPRGGSAGNHAYKITCPRELRFFASYVPNAIVQEFLPGPEITSDVIADFDGNLLAVVSRKRIAVRGGEAIKSVTVSDPRIHQACREIAKALPARGPITVQCMLKDGNPHYIEINARLGGGLPLAIAAGVDVPAILIALATGKAASQRLQPPGYTSGIYMTRCDESFFLTEAFRDATPRHPV